MLARLEIRAAARMFAGFRPAAAAAPTKCMIALPLLQRVPFPRFHLIQSVINRNLIGWRNLRSGQGPFMHSINYLRSSNPIKIPLPRCFQRQRLLHSSVFQPRRQQLRFRLPFKGMLVPRRWRRHRFIPLSQQRHQQCFHRQQRLLHSSVFQPRRQQLRFRLPFK